MPRYRVTLVRIAYSYAVQEADADSAEAAEARVSEALVAGELDLEWMHDDNEERVLLAELATVDGPGGEGAVGP